MDAAKDWKRELSFPINYDSDQSGEDWDDRDVVVMRSTKSSSYLLRDGGDGSEADLLGTTPPREIQRGKVKKKPFMAGLIKSISGTSKPPPFQQSPSVGSDRVRRAGRQMKRRSERDMKVDVSQAQARADSLPSPAQSPAVPTLVESCNRFMSLTSRLKCRSQFAEEEEEPALRRGGSDLTCVEEAKRASFHQTFSLLINMGNMEKGCKRTISREEQVWQNELKDLIWLELQARLSGRTLAQQDAFLCARRAAVPAVLQNIRDYSFVNPHPCKGSGLHGSQEGLTTDGEGDDQARSEELLLVGCLSLNCRRCSDAVGAALREVGTLLDSLDAAATLYPSGTAMTADHPLMATQLFQNRVKAMCLWYNTSRYLRMKVVAVRRMLRTMRLKGLKAQRRRHAFGSTDSDLSRQSSERRECTVRFNCPMSATPTDSSGSDGSCPRVDGNQCTSSDEVDHATEERDEDAVPTTPASKIEASETHESHGTHEPHEADEEHDSDEADEIGDMCGPYATADTVASSESGYGSSRELESHAHEDDLFDLGDLDDLAKLRLLGKCPVSLYRDYHHEMLKTQGVRRCMMFMNKMRLHVLHKVLETLEKPDSLSSEEHPSSPSPGAGPAPAEVFADAAEAPEPATPASQREEQLRQYERRRYGCWSEETLSMRLPSYRNHFLLLSSICMEAVHDYLSLRLEDRPENPSCLTVKQLIHELKEGLDIATEMRAAYARHIAVALAGHAAGQSARRALLAIVRTYDGTVETVLKQYLSYLRTMSAVERMSRWALQAEWAFAARLARRGRSAASLAPVTFAEIACNQLNRILNEFDAKFKDVQRREKEETSLDNDRYLVFTICREAQAIYASEREATLQAAQWARALAARLARAPPPAYQAERAALFECLMSLCSRIVQHTSYIMARSEPSELDAPPLEQEAMAARVRELLLQVYRLGFEVHRELQRFMAEQRGPARRGRPRLLRPDSVADDPDERLFENFPDGQTHPSIEQILIGEGAPSGADEALAMDPSHSAAAAWAGRAARAVVLFARCWMRFVVQRCDKGRGLRPRWASQGLEFLMLACDPCNTKHLTDEEFEELKKEMDGCISHVIGSRSARPGADSPDPTRRARATPPAIAPRQSPLVCSPPVLERPPAAEGSAPPPPTPPVEPDPLLSFHGCEHKAHSLRVSSAVRALDVRRDAQLTTERRVGRALGAAAAGFEPKLRQLNFKWQRGLKIGQGTFGKVYTVVNTESGQLLAMKELSIGAGAGDRRALQRAANELQVLEGIVHPHLVRYYGCELHREEMLIFMELCVEGSLEALVATAGALAEPTTRRYARQLLSAVAELHARTIAHRDIKSGNIFLTNEGHCLKLGDFGSAVKIRANTTAAGELQGYVGTQAYMAPEVFMKSTGHGRAADIWSLGCVVTEMATGKRPFSEYDSNYQIMFVVGMGRRPTIPETLSEEGQQFCLACLTHEPEQRPRAEELMLHHFLMVKADDEDCNCEPAFLIS